MDTAHWPQFAGGGGGGGGVVVKQMEGGGGSSSSSSSKPNNNNLLEMRKSGRPEKEQGGLKCPRCNSSNTKFCYYNNYSLSQPRYFCKACRRYWTEGGSLRNVPVGGGSRKNKRSSSLPSSSTSNSDHNYKKINTASDHQDLNLAIFPPPNHTNTSSSSPSSHLFNGFGLNHQMKPPSLSFSLEGFHNNGGYEDQDHTALMFPIEDLKQHNRGGVGDGDNGGDNNNNNNINNNNNSAGGFWNAMLGGGSW